MHERQHQSRCCHIVPGEKCGCSQKRVPCVFRFNIVIINEKGGHKDPQWSVRQLVLEFLKAVSTSNMASVSRIIFPYECRNTHSSCAAITFNPDFFSVVFDNMFKWKFSFHLLLYHYTFSLYSSQYSFQFHGQ